MPNRSAITQGIVSSIARRLHGDVKPAPKVKDKRKCALCGHVIGSHALRVKKGDLFCSACHASCVGIARPEVGEE